MDEERELIWAAGFFDGEGCTSPAKSKTKSGEVTGFKIHISIAQVQREPLDRFCEAVGVGKVYGPYEKEGPNQQPQYRYSIQSKGGCKQVIEKLYPYLCSVKRAQADRVIAMVDAQPNMLNSKYKTHCVNGHEFTPDNIYIPPKRPTRRYCMACMKVRNNGGTFSKSTIYNT